MNLISVVDWQCTNILESPSKARSRRVSSDMFNDRVPDMKVTHEVYSRRYARRGKSNCRPGGHIWCTLLV